MPAFFMYNKLILARVSRGVIGGWAIAHPIFGRIEFAAGQQLCAALLLAQPVLGSQLRPCLVQVSTTLYIKENLDIQDMNKIILIWWKIHSNEESC